MLARLSLATLAIASVALALPGPAAPVDHVAANCIQVEGVDDCINPCMTAAAPYNTARHAAGLEDQTPDAQCPA